MHLGEALQASWHASLDLGFENVAGRSLLARRRAEGPLVVQKPLYPEGPGLCHAIVVHPPSGIVGGDQLALSVAVEVQAKALLTTPGAGKWYRSKGPWARQKLSFEISGVLEWLPRETIVFDGALAELECEVKLSEEARYIGWEIVCLGRTGSGERYTRGRLRLDTKVIKAGKPVWVERGELEGGAALMRSPVGLAGCSVFGTLIAAAPDFTAELIQGCRQVAAVTRLPGLLVARYLGNSTEEAFQRFSHVWSLLRPSVAGRPALAPRIWQT